MYMVPFYIRFPQLALRETRTATLRGHPELPDGEYGFVELFCDDPKCDCQRAIISVMNPASKGPMATISYGWKSDRFYREWSNVDDDEMSGLYLDPLNPQSRYAQGLLKLFEQMLEDRTYAERIQRHYKMFKADLKKPRGGKHLRKK